MKQNQVKLSPISLGPQIMQRIDHAHAHMQDEVLRVIPSSHSTSTSTGFRASCCPRTPKFCQSWNNAPPFHVIGQYDGIAEPTTGHDHIELVAPFRNEVWNDSVADMARKSEIGLVDVERYDSCHLKFFHLCGICRFIDRMNVASSSVKTFAGTIGVKPLIALRSSIRKRPKGSGHTGESGGRYMGRLDGFWEMFKNI